MIGVNDEGRRFAPESNEKGGVKFTIKSAISGIMLTVFLAIIVVVVLAYFTQVTFQGEINWKEQGANALLLTVCSVAATVVMRQWGRLKGENVAERLKAIEEVKGNIKTITDGKNRGRAGEYCRAWEETEYTETLKRILEPYNITVEQFKKMRICNGKEIKSNYSGLTEEQVKAVLKAKKVKRLKYSEEFILTTLNKHERRAAPDGGLTANQRNAIMTVHTIVTAVIISLITVTFMFEIISEPNLATVVSCLVKVLTLVLSAALAAYRGYNLSAVVETERLQRQIAEQKNFIAFCEENPKNEVFQSTLGEIQNPD